jgi:uncharacterized protein YydD (DUF2326 family)
MIHRLFSSLPSFRTLRFKPGLNILLADRGPSSTETDTRNGAGKTSVVDLIQFLLGGDWEKARDPALINQSFGLEFDLGGERVTVRRSGQNPTRVFFDPGTNASRWPIRPESYIGALSLRVDEWNAVLGAIVFGLPAALHEERFRPKFRGLISYFVRRVKEGAMLHPQGIHQHQKLWDQQVSIAYLLGLDWTLAREMERIRSKEKLRLQLRRLIAEEEGTELSDTLPNSAELRTRVTLTTQRATGLKQSLASFRVVPEYHELEAEADRLTAELSALSDENTVAREIITDLERALAVEAPPGSAEVARVYAEAGLLLPERAVRQFDEVRAFHESVIRNRRSYLEDELSNTRQLIRDRDAKERTLDERRAKILETLRTSGALESFTQLQEEFAHVQASVEHLKEQYEHAATFENAGREIVVERAQLESRLAQNHREQADQIRHAVLIFAAVSKRLYKEPGRLTISDSLVGSPIAIEIARQDSEGVASMQIFCFDVMLLQLTLERQTGPGFLVHDSHIFDGVDERQIRHGLETAADVAATPGAQYITMLNSDIAGQLGGSDLKLEQHVIEPRLSDQEGGGLFGLAFGARGALKKERARRRS